MDWIDRITGARHAAPEIPVIPGQWEYGGQHRITIRDAVVRSGDVVFPGTDGRCQAPSLGPVRCDPHYTPDDDALRSLRLIGERLRALESKPWRDWVAETPLLPALEDALDETPLERAIVAKLGHLEAACERPRTHLRIDEERVVIGRCKRPSVKAPTELAARSEDWERRTLWGVRPRRVRAMVRDELYDIYENRVAVSLVDNLDVALLLRLRSVRRVVQLLKQREDYQHVLEDSHNYRRAHRILELWGKAQVDEGQLKHAVAVQHRIMTLRRRVLALKDSILYREIGGRRHGRLQLRMTNVLSHDEVYRRVAELWIAWEQHIRSQSLDPDIRWRQEQDAASGFNRFLFLLIVRALNALGFGPSGTGEAIGAEGSWTLVGPVGSILLRRDRSGVSVHSAHADGPMKFVGLPAMIEAGVTIGEWMDKLRGLSVVAALPADEPRAPMEVRIRLRTYSDACHGGPLFVTVAPWDIESVERVARIIRWHAWAALYARYRFAVRLPADWDAPTSMPPWIRIDNQTLRVIRPPAPAERSWSDLDTMVAAEGHRLTALGAKLDACDARDKGRRARLKQELDAASVVESTSRQVRARLESAVAATDLLRACPVCRTVADVYAFKYADDLFRCSCEDCKATWGRRTCGACRKPFPFLDFPGNPPSEDILDADRRYGADVLALPIAIGVYLCSICGQRSASERVRDSGDDDVHY